MRRVLSWARTHRILAGIIAFVAVSIVVGAINSGTAKTSNTAAASTPSTPAASAAAPSAPATSAAPSPTPAAVKTSPAAPSPSPSPQGTHLASQAVRDKAAQILTTATDHYAQVFAQGQQIVGTTQYADANTGLAALQDPTSAASQFSAWRQSSKVEQDVNTYMDAFSQADSGFDASDEPASISTWRDDVGNVQSDIAQWVQTAVSYQISTATQSDLDAAAAKVQADLKTARNDVADVQAGR